MSRWKIALIMIDNHIKINGDRYILNNDIYAKEHKWRVMMAVIEILLMAAFIILVVVFREEKLKIMIAVWLGVLVIDYIGSALILPKDMENCIYKKEEDVPVNQEN